MASAESLFSSGGSIKRPLTETVGATLVVLGIETLEDFSFIVNLLGGLIIKKPGDLENWPQC